MLPTLTDTQLIYMFQIVQFVIIFVQFIPQIIKTYKLKTVGDISLTHWIMKLIYTLLSIFMLVLSHNDLIIVLSQIFNLIFTGIILAQLVYYGFIKKGDDQK